MKLERIDYLAALVAAGEAALGAYVWAFGKAGRLPMHFGLSGAVDGWGDRHEVGLTLAAFGVGTAVGYALLPALALGRNDRAPGRQALPVARLIILTTSILIALMLAAIGAGVLDAQRPQIALRLGMAMLAMVLIALGAWVGKAEPSPLVGVRTFWSLRSRRAWDKSNRLFGRLAFWGGLVGLIASPVAPQPLAFQILVGGLLAASAAAVFESWRVWRIDPDRLRPGHDLLA